jgi:hypothetical protein
MLICILTGYRNTIPHNHPYDPNAFHRTHCPPRSPPTCRRPPLHIFLHGPRLPFMATNKGLRFIPTLELMEETLDGPASSSAPPSARVVLLPRRSPTARITVRSPLQPPAPATLLRARVARACTAAPAAPALLVPTPFAPAPAAPTPPLTPALEALTVGREREQAIRGERKIAIGEERSTGTGERRLGFHRGAAYLYHSGERRLDGLDSLEARSDGR